MVTAADDRWERPHSPSVGSTPCTNHHQNAGTIDIEFGRRDAAPISVQNFMVALPKRQLRTDLSPHYYRLYDGRAMGGSTGGSGRNTIKSGRRTLKFSDNGGGENRCRTYGAVVSMAHFQTARRAAHLAVLHRSGQRLPISTTVRLLQLGQGTGAAVFDVDEICDNRRSRR